MAKASKNTKIAFIARISFEHIVPGILILSIILIL